MISRLKIPFKNAFILISDSGDWYAYINYYSSKAAEKALKTFGTNNLVINGQSCRLVRKNRDLTSNGRPLSLHQCEKLANFYLGFNGWTSQILYHQLEAEEKTQGQQGQGGGNKTYATAIKLKFPNFNLNVEGVGIAEAEFLNLTEKLHQIAMAQKFSRSAAMVNAFSKVILVLVHNSYKNDGGLHFVTEPGPKLTVRINTTKNDPFHYNPLWDDKPMIDQVNQLSASPDFED